MIRQFVLLSLMTAAMCATIKFVTDEDIDGSWDKFKTTYGKTYTGELDLARYVKNSLQFCPVRHFLFSYGYLPMKHQTTPQTILPVSLLYYTQTS